MIDCNDNESVLVTILCITYNHESYIRQCLEGFVMQKTNFRFEAVVHDDASTDDTTAIVKEYEEKYPDIIKAIYESENQYSKRDGSIGRKMDTATRGKYIAICEGDDYWIDPLKLQKQVDFMEENSDYSLCHTAFQYYYEEEGIYKNGSILLECSNQYEIILNIIDGNKYRIQTNTVLFRRDVQTKVLSTDDFLYTSGYFLMGDTPLWVGLLLEGNIYYIDDVTAVYRVHKGSVSRDTDYKKNMRFNLSCSELRLYFLNKIEVSRYLKNKFKKEYSRNLLKYSLFDPHFIPLFKYSGVYIIYSKILSFPFCGKLLRYLLKPFIERRLL